MTIIIALMVLHIITTIINLYDSTISFFTKNNDHIHPCMLKIFWSTECFWICFTLVAENWFCTPSSVSIGKNTEATLLVATSADKNIAICLSIPAVGLSILLMNVLVASIIYWNPPYFSSFFSPRSSSYFARREHSSWHVIVLYYWFWFKSQTVHIPTIIRQCRCKLFTINGKYLCCTWPSLFYK